MNDYYDNYSGFLNVVIHQKFLFFPRFGDRPVLLAGFSIIFCGFIILLPWGNRFPKIQWAGTCFIITTASV